MEQGNGHRGRVSRWMVRGAVAVCVMGVVGAMGSCERRAVRTETEVVEDFAQRVLDGVDFGLSGRIQADSWDTRTRMFERVRIDGSPDQIGTAERAELIVDRARFSVVLRLHGVMFADSESGSLVSREGLVTDPIMLNERFIPDKRDPVEPIDTTRSYQGR